MTPVPPKPDGQPYAVTPNGTPILVRDDHLEWIDDWTNALAVTLDESFRPHDDTGALITPASIGAAPASHTHTPAEVGAAPASHTHAVSQITGIYTAQVVVNVTGNVYTQESFSIPAGIFSSASDFVVVASVNSYGNVYAVRALANSGTSFIIGLRHVDNIASTDDVVVNVICMKRGA